MSIEFLKAPCDCRMDCPSKISLMFLYNTEKHQALHRELELGIIHNWSCKMEMIEIPKLIFRPPSIAYFQGPQRVESYNYSPIGLLE